MHCAAFTEVTKEDSYPMDTPLYLDYYENKSRELDKVQCRLFGRPGYLEQVDLAPQGALLVLKMDKQCNLYNEGTKFYIAKGLELPVVEVKKQVLENDDG